MTAWYTSGAAPAGVKAALAAEGVTPRDTGFDYEWTQDVAFFRQDGSVALLADAPPRLLQQLGLTMGVLNNEDGYPQLTALAEADAAGLDLPYRRMRYTFLEGGGLITGRFADGRPYAITTQSPVYGAALIYEYLNGATIGETEARRLVAEDLGVEPSDLFVVPARGHLDLFITPLRGGTLLLSDPGRSLAALKSLLPKAPPAERKRLKAMIKLYREGWKRYPDSRPEFPYDENDQKLLDAAAAALAGRFTVVRAAGVFQELVKYGNSDGLYPADYINFFNGVTGANAAGELFQITNSGRGLTALEAYWTELLSGLGVARAHFPGSYALGAGLDCTGAPAAR